MNTAIVFFSHAFDDTAVAHLRKLEKESVGSGTLFVYADVKGQDPPASIGEVVRFDFEEIRQRYPQIFGDTLIPGNCHLTLLDFFKRYPDFQQYWVIEYDVMFTGHWREFFAAFAGREADFLASHVRRYEEQPGFDFWDSLRAPDDRRLSSDTLLRAFCPVQRVSRRALEFLEVKAREGWTGHFEGLVPTLLANHGYVLEDLGGDGSYVPRGFKNRFYTSFTWKDGKLRHFGTMRYRPAFTSVRRARKNTLYHPVKHRRVESTSGAAPAPDEQADRARKRSYVRTHLRADPLSFSVALARWCFAEAIARAKTSPFTTVLRRMRHALRAASTQLRHVGLRYTCPFCRAHLRSFLPFGLTFPVLEATEVVGGGYRQNAVCPRCGSLDRERLVYLFVVHKTSLLAKPTKLLHVAPEGQLSTFLRSVPTVDYTTADLQSPYVMVNMDITRMEFPDEHFDAIICNHVLEHIPDDRQAMAELYRTLAPGGWAVLQVPFSMRLPLTYEDRSITSPLDRTTAFGQHDHVRIYGRDYRDRLEAAGFKVDVFSWMSDGRNFGGLRNRFGLNDKEVVYFARK